MKNSFFFYCFLFLCNITFSQSNDFVQGKGISATALNTAKAMYLEMMKTPIFKEREECAKDYAHKLPQGFAMENLVDESAFIKYISENLQLSKFKTVDEALELRKRCADIEDKLYNDNLELFKLMQSATVEQNKIILAPMFARYHD